MWYISAILNLASRPWTRLIEDDLWYLPVRALAGLGLLLLFVSRTEGSQDTCDIGVQLDSICVRTVPSFQTLMVRVAPVCC